MKPKKSLTLLAGLAGCLLMLAGCTSADAGLKKQPPPPCMPDSWTGPLQPDQVFCGSGSPAIRSSNN